jgi:hypothetical protein
VNQTNQGNVVENTKVEHNGVRSAVLGNGSSNRKWVEKTR